MLLYYAITNASALTLTAATMGSRLLPAIGLVACLTLAVTLPVTAVVTGTAVVLIGMLTYAITNHGV